MSDSTASTCPEMRRILIVGDSNCLPRRDAKYRGSWVQLLKQALPNHDFIVLADGSRTTEYLVLNPFREPDGSVTYDPTSLEMFEPAIVIINLGIVDCAPRLFSRMESRVISTLPSALRRLVIASARRMRRRSSGRAYVQLAAFEANLRQYLARCHVAAVERVILIGIPTPDLRCVQRNPAIRTAVAAYNDVLAHLAAEHDRTVFLDPLYPEQEVSILYSADGYHLSPHGHQMVYQAIASVISPART